MSVRRKTTFDEEWSPANLAMMISGSKHFRRCRMRTCTVCMFVRVCFYDRSAGDLRNEGLRVFGRRADAVGGGGFSPLRSVCDRFETTTLLEIERLYRPRKDRAKIIHLLPLCQKSCQPISAVICCCRWKDILVTAHATVREGGFSGLVYICFLVDEIVILCAL